MDKMFKGFFHYTKEEKFEMVCNFSLHFTHIAHLRQVIQVVHVLIPRSIKWETPENIWILGHSYTGQSWASPFRDDMGRSGPLWVISFELAHKGSTYEGNGLYHVELAVGWLVE